MSNPITRLFSRLFIKLVSPQYFTSLMSEYVERHGADMLAKVNGWNPSVLIQHPNAYRVPPDHWHSVYPDINLVKERWRHIAKAENIGISLEIEKQLAFANELESLFRDFPYKPNRAQTCVESYHNESRLRFLCDSENKTFQLDSVALYAMLRYFKPRKIIEVGSGYSSSIMLDVREIEKLDDQSLVFIEPYNQQRLFKLLRNDDRSNTEIIEKPLWEVDIDLFKSLGKGDLLFIDSSHVAKIGSDVYDYIFRILPHLNPGVLIHIHDITPSFGISRSWFNRGLYWNEGAFLKAFLMYNNDFEVLFHSSYLLRHHADSPGINALSEHRRTTFYDKKWSWASSFYLRRKH